VLCLTLLSLQPNTLRNQPNKGEVTLHKLDSSCDSTHPSPPIAACMSVPGCCRQAPRVGTKMLSMAVQADKLCISANEAGVDDGEAMTDSQVHFIHHITHASHLPAMHACPQWQCLIYADIFACVFPDPYTSGCDHTASSLCHSFHPSRIKSGCGASCDSSDILA
jgi:hypothetical protein